MKYKYSHPHFIHIILNDDNNNNNNNNIRIKVTPRLYTYYSLYYLCFSSPSRALCDRVRVEYLHPTMYVPTVGRERARDYIGHAVPSAASRRNVNANADDDADAEIQTVWLYPCIYQ